MKSKKIFILLSFLFFAMNQLTAKDQTHEKPDEFPEPDKHRIFFRSSIGYGNYTILEYSEGKRIAEAASAISFFTSAPALYFSTMQKYPIAAQASLGLEYRYMDKLRIMYDQRSISVTPYGSSGFINRNSTLPQYNEYDWEENILKMGFAYYHPIFSRLNLGIILRNYTIEHSYGLAKIGIYNSSIGTNFQLGTSISAIGSYSKANGLVPGIGLELKIFRWLDFIYTNEQISLKGIKSDFAFSGIFLISTPLLGISITNSPFHYTGMIQNAAFLFKYSSWFSTKLGVSNEKYQKQYDSFYVLSENSSPVSVILTSLIYSNFIKSTSTLNYAYIQFEFSKGF